MPNDHQTITIHSAAGTRPLTVQLASGGAPHYLRKLINNVLIKISTGQFRGELKKEAPAVQVRWEDEDDTVVIYATVTPAAAMNRAEATRCAKFATDLGCRNVRVMRLNDVVMLKATARINMEPVAL